MRYKVWRCHGDPEKMLHVMIVADPPEGPDTNWHAHVPEQIKPGPWVGGPEGRVSRLKAHYRALLREQGFVVLNQRAASLDLERPLKTKTPER